MNPMGRPLRLGVAFSAICASLAVLSAQDGELKVPPIPAAERFIPGTGLKVRLTVDHPAVAAFENPGFRAVFENVGRTTLYLNPGVASNIYLYDEAGRSTPTVGGYISERR
jgi:hypothetical protein